MGPGHGLAPSFSLCAECGTYHPPVRGKCPMVKDNEPKTEADLTEISINKFLNNMRVQLGIKIKVKKIKEVDKIFMYLSEELNKLMENYHE